MPILDMNRVQYNALQALNYSGMKELLRSPRHYQEYLTRQEEPSKALRIGTMVHAAVLQPDVFQRYKPAPDVKRNTTAGKEAYALWASMLKNDEQVCDADEYELALRVSDKMNQIIERLGIKALETEKTVTATDRDVLLKSSIDLIADDGYLYDLKTTEDASPNGFMKSVKQYKYNLQAVTYLMNFERFYKTRPKGFRFIVVEKDAPNEGAIYELGAGIMADGITMYEKALKLYSDCDKAGVWPGYTNEIITLDYPDRSQQINFA